MLQHLSALVSSAGDLIAKQDGFTNDNYIFRFTFTSFSREAKTAGKRQESLRRPEVPISESLYGGLATGPEPRVVDTRRAVALTFGYCSYGKGASYGGVGQRARKIDGW